VSVDEAVRAIVASPRAERPTFKAVREMRALIAQEKGDDDPWDLKLARGGLTDLDFIAQALVLAHANAHPVLAGLATEATFMQSAEAGLMTPADAAFLVEAHQLFNAIFQWQRLTIEGPFDAPKVPRPILSRLAAVAGLPTPKALLQSLAETRGKVRTIFERTLAG
jgi:glutamate-ammonia-ligase adenylyltransferase